MRSDWPAPARQAVRQPKQHCHHVSPSWWKKQCFKDAGAKRQRIIRTTSVSGMETLTEVGSATRSSRPDFGVGNAPSFSLFFVFFFYIFFFFFFFFFFRKTTKKTKTKENFCSVCRLVYPQI